MLEVLTHAVGTMIEKVAEDMRFPTEHVARATLSVTMHYAHRTNCTLQEIIDAATSEFTKDANVVPGNGQKH